VSPDLLATLGPLAIAVTDDIHDLCILGDGRVWRRSASGFSPTDIVLDPREARRIGVGIIDRAGGRVDDARPIADAALAGEVRVHVALPPVARNGPIVTLRFPRRLAVTRDNYCVDSSWSWSELTGQSVLVTGATGSGKTTLLEVLISEIPPSDRIVVMEDIPEIVARHPNTVSLVTRPANAEGAGEITLRSLVRESLRMSPDRLVLGEVRGSEILDLLMALTTGHRGLSSLHARSLDDIPERMIALGMVAGMAPETVAQLAVVAFDRVIHCERTVDGISLQAGVFKRTGSSVEVVR
jgi:pilus assembly protein CpaF